MIFIAVCVCVCVYPVGCVVPDVTGSWSLGECHGPQHQLRPADWGLRSLGPNPAENWHQKHVL